MHWQVGSLPPAPPGKPLLVEYLSSIISPCFPVFVNLSPSPKRETPQPLVLGGPYHPLIATILVPHHSCNCSPTATSFVNTLHLFARNSDTLLTKLPYYSFTSFTQCPSCLLVYKNLTFPWIKLFQSPVTTAHFPLFLYHRVKTPKSLPFWSSGLFHTITL